MVLTGFIRRIILRQEGTSCAVDCRGEIRREIHSFNMRKDGFEFYDFQQAWCMVNRLLAVYR